MVDCGNSRCAQEKRVFKKELLSWSKKVPLIVGLEQVAAEVFGPTLMSTLLEPFNNLETVSTEDWQAQTVCYLCRSRNKFIMDAVQDSMETEASPADNPGLRYLQQLLPLAFPASSLADSAEADPGKPLDLSATASVAVHSPGRPLELEPSTSPSRPLVELKVPQILTKSGKRKEPGGKKGYTEDELAAAVSDIRSGKLGTRRAAVLYGIPRSTLRNKIFKLESESHNGQDGKLSISDLLQAAPNGDLLSSVMFDEDAGSLSGNEESWDRKLEHIRRKHNLGLSHERPFGMPPLAHFNNRFVPESERGFQLHNPYAHELKLPLLPHLVRKMAEQRMQLERLHANPFDLDLAMAKDLGLGLGTQSASNALASQVELKIPSYRPMRSYTNGDTAGDSEDSNSAPASNKIGDTLKDVIAKTIAEKVRSRAQVNEVFQKVPYNSAPGGLLYQNGTININVLSGGSHSSGMPACKKPKLQPKVNKTSAQSSNENSLQAETKQQDKDKQQDGKEDKPVKKTRPKRGQYRKYNSQLLMEAVRAVQRGEMSVHRAGSYFGVPHSTLEYKVKERHLLRQKKPRESRKKPDNTQSQQQTTPSTPAAPPPAHGGVIVATPSVNSSHLSAVLNGPVTQSNGTIHKDTQDTSMAAYNTGFALNTSASELLKKLQQKVQAKAGLTEASSNEVRSVLSEGGPLVVKAGKTSDLTQVTVQ